jgi:hypothetical protein
VEGAVLPSARYTLVRLPDGNAGPTASVKP